MPKLRRVDVASFNNQSSDPQITHIRYPRRRCRRSLFPVDQTPLRGKFVEQRCCHIRLRRILFPRSSLETPCLVQPIEIGVCSSHQTAWHGARKRLDLLSGWRATPDGSAASSTNTSSAGDARPHAQLAGGDP